MRGRVFILLLIFKSTEHINMLYIGIYTMCVCVHVCTRMCVYTYVCLMFYVLCFMFYVLGLMSYVMCACVRALLLFLFLTNNYVFCEKVEQIANFHCFFAIFL